MVPPKLTALAATSTKFGLIILVLFGAASQVNVCGQVPKKEVDNREVTVWRLDKPEVNAISHDYPEVQFRNYDEVIVRGGGCVDTGGIGRTWKRYINPSGDNSDRLYHGRISIPGATAGLVRISSIEGLHLVINKFPEHIDDRLPSPPYLTLGYEDDDDRDHRNNKYEADDADDAQIRHKATGNQCALGNDPEAKHGNAWLEITIKHHDNPEQVSPRNPIPRAPLDLWWEAVDENNLPLNPDWWTHHAETAPDPELPQLSVAKYPNSNDPQHCDRFREGPHDFLKMGRSTKCTMQDPDVDEAAPRQFPCHFGSLPSSAIYGHANWAVVTYRGQIYFDIANNGVRKLRDVLEGNVVGDGDYDWLFVTEGDRGLSTGNVADSTRARDEEKLPPNHNPGTPGVRALALEFSSRETIDNFKNSKWWSDFHALVNNDPDGARQLVSGKQAIVIGLIGFDNEHGARSAGARVELHPVFGLAIKDDSKSNEDVWAIFARNWGNEGFCSNGFDLGLGRSIEDKSPEGWQHYLPLPGNKLTFFLPANLKSDSGIQHIFPPNEKDGLPRGNYKIVDGGILVTIELHAPDSPDPRNKNLFWGELHIPK